MFSQDDLSWRNYDKKKKIKDLTYSNVSIWCGWCSRAVIYNDCGSRNKNDIR